MTENIHTAINKVMREVGYVQKEKAGGLPYSFAGEAQLIAALRPHMVENDIIMFVANKPEVTSEVFTTTKGTAMNRVMMTCMIRFQHAPSQTAIDVYAVGEGMDAGDKATNKAATGAYKYALRQTFCIETGDDPDKQPSQEQERNSPTPGLVDGNWHSGNASTVRSFLSSHEIINDDANANHIAQLMNLSPFKPGGKLDIEWFKIYRKRRDEGLSSKEAADTANSEWED